MSSHRCPGPFGTPLDATSRRHWITQVAGGMGAWALLSLLERDGLAASLARLPWQATLAITFVIFPMVSAATFTDDPQRARDYVRQTLRYSLLLIATAAVAFTAVPTLIVDGGVTYIR